jgi:polyphosphate kinase
MRNLDTYLADNVNAWELLDDGSYKLQQPQTGEEEHCAQRMLLEQYAETY